MGLIKKAMEGTRHLNVWHWGIMKICLISGSFMLATLIPAIITVDWRIYGIIFVVTYILTLTFIFKKKK